MEILDNKIKKLGDDIKKELKSVDGFDFIFTNPTFIKKEVQFKKKVELNQELRNLEKELEELIDE